MNQLQTSTAASASHSSFTLVVETFFFSCSYYPSTFELSWLYNEISSWDKICHCGAVLPTGSVEAANSLIRSLTYSSWSPSWNLSEDLPSFLKWKPKSDDYLPFKTMNSKEERMFLCYFLPPYTLARMWAFSLKIRNHHMPRSYLWVCSGSLPRFPTQTQNKGLVVVVMGTHFQLTAKSGIK